MLTRIDNVDAVGIWSSLLYLTTNTNRRLSLESTCKSIIVNRFGKVELDTFKSWKSLLLYIVHKYSQLYLHCKQHRISKQYNSIGTDPEVRAKNIINNYKVEEGDIISWDEGFIFSDMKHEICIGSKLVHPIQVMNLTNFGELQTQNLAGIKFPLTYWSNVLPNLNIFAPSHNLKSWKNFTIPKHKQPKYSKPFNTFCLYTVMIDYIEYTLISYLETGKLLDKSIQFMVCRILTLSDKYTISLLQEFGIDYNFDTYLMVQSQYM